MSRPAVVADVPLTILEVLREQRQFAPNMAAPTTIVARQARHGNDRSRNKPPAAPGRRPSSAVRRGKKRDESGHRRRVAGDGPWSRSSPHSGPSPVTSSMGTTAAVMVAVPSQSMRCFLALVPAVQRVRNDGDGPPPPIGRLTRNTQRQPAIAQDRRLPPRASPPTAGPDQVGRAETR